MFVRSGTASIGKLSAERTPSPATSSVPMITRNLFFRAASISAFSIAHQPSFRVLDTHCPLHIHQPRTNHQPPPATNDQPLATNHQPLATNHPLLVLLRLILQDQLALEREGPVDHDLFAGR